jgi:hypothetical protein
MTFLINIFDVQSKWEEEALTVLRDIDSCGNPELTIRLLKTLNEYFIL